MGVLPMCMSVSYVHDWCMWQPEEGITYSGTELTDCYEWLCGNWIYLNQILGRATSDLN